MIHDNELTEPILRMLQIEIHNQPNLRHLIGNHPFREWLDKLCSFVILRNKQILDSSPPTDQDNPFREWIDNLYGNAKHGFIHRSSEDFPTAHDR